MTAEIELETIEELLESGLAALDGGDLDMALQRWSAALEADPENERAARLVRELELITGSGGVHSGHSTSADFFVVVEDEVVTDEELHPDTSSPGFRTTGNRDGLLKAAEEQCTRLADSLAKAERGELDAREALLESEQRLLAERSDRLVVERKLQGLEEAIRDTERFARIREANLRRIDGQRADAEAELARLRAEVEALQVAARGAQTEIAVQHAELERSQQALAAALEELKQREAAADSAAEVARAQYQSAASELQAVRKELEAAWQELDSARQELAAAQGALDASQKEIEALREESRERSGDAERTRELEAEVDHLRRASMAQHESLEAFELAVAGLETERDGALSDLKVAEERVSQLEGLLTGHDAEMENLGEALHTAARAAEDRSVALQGEVDELRIRLAAGRGREDALEEEIAVLRARLSELETSPVSMRVTSSPATVVPSRDPVDSDSLTGIYQAASGQGHIAQVQTSVAQRDNRAAPTLNTNSTERGRGFTATSSTSAALRLLDPNLTSVERLAWVMDETPTVSRLDGVPRLSAHAAFVLQNIDGTVSFADLIDIVGLPSEETSAILVDLLNRGIISSPSIAT